MRTKPRVGGRLLAGVGLLLGALAGCQTYYGGMTLPSPRYLEHPPTYAPESPPFPYARELAGMQAQAAQAEAGLPLGLPARVPAGPIAPYLRSGPSLGPGLCLGPHCPQGSVLRISGSAGCAGSGRQSLQDIAFPGRARERGI
jgi:hypothetical protein